MPVLSNANTRSRPTSSRYCPPLTRTPRRAALASALTTATGVAITRAQGQAITSTTSPRENQSSQAASAPAASRTNGGATITPAATATTSGVYHAANLAIRRSTGALPACASRTRAMTREIKASPIGPAASISSAPSPFTVPAKTGSPGPFDTGTDSPVIVF